MDNIYLPEGLKSSRDDNNEYINSLSGLEYAMEKGIILEGRAVLCDLDRNLHVELGGIAGIIPKEEAVYSPSADHIKDIAIITRVGKNVCFKVTDIQNCNGKVRAVLSRRLAQKECCENYISKLMCGDIIDASVTHIEQFGAFCDIGCGLIALLPVDCISVSRIKSPAERFYCGQSIKCVVKDIQSDIYRVTLTHRELLGTWQENISAFNAGETVSGIVRSIEPYGIFVELAPNLAGLAEWCDGVSVGNRAAVYIKSIIPEKMKIKLAIVNVSDQEVLPEPITYFYKGSHMDFWQYSPDGCTKNIFTSF